MTGEQALRAALFRARAESLKPPHKLSLSEWAARYGVLSPETSAQSGRFRAYAYQNGMMDAVTDPSVTEISVMKSARVGFTKVIDLTIGYYIHQDPSPMMLVQPRVEDAEDYSSTEIEPMLRDTPELAAIVGDFKARDAKQRLLKRVFRNGSSISFLGANSPGGFRRITARIIMFDEVDGYPVTGAGKEGDQIRLGKRRAQTFWNSKFILGSTPTIKGESRIEKSFLQSDQRRYFVPCPHCGEYQILEWGGPETPHGIKWKKDDAGRGIAETVYYVCRHNGCIIDDADKPEMLEHGEWRATAPFKGHAGFHIWTGYSLDPKASWQALAAEWLEVAHDPLQRQTFINTVLGEPYEDRGDKALNELKLAARCEVLDEEVHDRVAVVTAGVDTQDYRLEIEVVGWGRNEESWSLAHHVIEGDTQEPDVWRQLDLYLKRIWRRADGRGFPISAACVDSGGHATQAVYAFSKERLGRRIWAIKGESARGGMRSPVWPTKSPSSRNKQSFRPIIIGVNAAKDSIRNRLHIEPSKNGEPIPGYMHFPADRDVNYFAQLVAERSVTKELGGQRFRVWELPPGRANEALDCRVYAYAALCGLLYKGLKLNRRADEIEASTDTLVPEPLPPVPAGILAVEKPKKSLSSMLAH